MLLVCSRTRIASKFQTKVFLGNTLLMIKNKANNTLFTKLHATLSALHGVIVSNM